MQTQSSEADFRLSREARAGQDILEDIVLAIETHQLGIPRHDRETIRWIQNSQIDRYFRWEYGDVKITLGIRSLTIITPEWHLSLQVSQSVFDLSAFIVGDPDACLNDMRAWVLYADPVFWNALKDEVAIRKQPFRFIPIPGKKKAREKVSTDQLEVGGTQEPVFGKPETGKKPRKGRK